MTDMHREAFERWFSQEFSITNHEANHRDMESAAIRSAARRSWQAAISHLTEQNEQRDSHE